MTFLLIGSSLVAHRGSICIIGGSLPYVILEASLFEWGFNMHSWTAVSTEDLSSFLSLRQAHLGT